MLLSQARHLRTRLPAERMLAANLRRFPPSSALIPESRRSDRKVLHAADPIRTEIGGVFGRES